MAKVPSQDPALILPGLYLGSRKAAADKELLTTLGITHVLNLTGPKHDSDSPRFPNPFPEDFCCLHICISDEIFVPIAKSFPEAHVFIEKGLEGQNKCLVHCDAGISRSATVILSYLIKNQDMTLRSALEHVTKRKNNVGPNVAFFTQLLEYEEERRGARSISLTEYLAKQLLNGPASMFTESQVMDALRKCDNDPNRAACLLWE